MRERETYRSERRNDWAVARVYSTMPWRKWNIGFHIDDGHGVAKHPVAGHIQTKARSKYMPHESKKRGGSGPVLATH